MNIFCCRIRNLIPFLLIIYFIPMVVGPPTKKNHANCVAQIYEVFKIENDAKDNKKEHFKYAILNLRKLTKREKKAYVQKTNLVEDIDHPLLYDAPNDQIVNNEYAYEYFKSIAKGYEIGLFPKQRKFCNGFIAEKEDCSYTLQYFGLLGKARDVIHYVFFHLVIQDFEPNEPDSNVKDEQDNKNSTDMDKPENKRNLTEECIASTSYKSVDLRDPWIQSDSTGIDEPENKINDFMSHRLIRNDKEEPKNKKFVFEYLKEIAYVGSDDLMELPAVFCTLD